MIPISSTMTETDTLPGRPEVEFRIGDPRFVMLSLADLYSNKELAVTREYSTNARDAMVEAGKENEPIRVTLPSALNPYFKVQDFGTGLSEQELEEVYTSFGDSTKRGSLKANGLLGFGCKSAVAYTTTFTVTSVKNGRKSVAVISKKADLRIVLKVVASSLTDEPDGTEVVVPVHNWQEFTQKANDFYRFWMPGTVLVNGVEPKHAVGEKINDNLYYSTNYGTSYVVMSNVAYRIANPSALFRNAAVREINFVAYVDHCNCSLVNDGKPHAAIEHTPSREDLKYTDHTNATLARIVEDFEKKILVQAQSEIDNSKTYFDAYLKWSEWRGQLGTTLFKALKFKGEQLVEEFPITAMRYKPNAYRRSAYAVTKWSLSNMETTVVITEFPSTLNSGHKAKAREYAQLKNLRANTFLFTHQSTVDSVWVDQTKFVKWEDLKNALPKKAPKARGGYSGTLRIPGTFDYYTSAGFTREAELPDDKNMYFIRVKEKKQINVPDALPYVDPNAAVVVLAANRIDKFTRDNPTVKDFYKVARDKVVTKGESLLCDKAKEVMSFNYDTKNLLSGLDTDRIDDPEFARLKNLLANNSGLTKRYTDNNNLAIAVGMRYNVLMYRATTKDCDLLIKYPLLRSQARMAHKHEHVYIYLNAAYAASKKGN